MLTVIILFKEGFDTLEPKYKLPKSNVMLVCSSSSPTFYEEEEVSSVSWRSPNSIAE